MTKLAKSISFTRSKLKSSPGIANRIKLIFIVISAFLLLLGWLNYQQVSTLIQEENNLVNTYNDSQRKTLTLVSMVDQSNLIVQDEVINRSVARSSLRNRLWEQKINPCLDSLEDEQDHWQDVDLKLKFATIRMNLKKLRRYQEEIERLLKNQIAGPSFVLDSLGGSNQNRDEMAFNATVNVLSIYRKKLSGGSGIINQVQAQFGEFEGLQSQDLQMRIDDLRSSIRFFFALYLFLLVAFLALIAYSGWMLLDNILEKINRVKGYVWDFSRGNIPENIEVSKDEVGEVLIGLQDLARNLEKIKEFAHTVRDGNFDHRLEIIQSKGDLGQSLKEMQEGLLAVARRDQQRNRTNEGIALFGNLLREYSDSQSLYDSLVSNMVKYLGANQGGIFILNDQEPDNEFLELQSIYAFNRKRFEQKKIRPGQGLVGQSWLEKDVIYLEETDLDYVQIESGLGGAKPRSILIIPLINNESKVLGALELASFNKFEAYEIDFVNRVGEMIVSTISTLKNNEKNQELLREAQDITTQMRVKEDELKGNLNELMLTQEEMRKNQAALQSQTFAIDNTLATAELDLNGQFIKVNDIFLNAIRYQREDVIGRPYDFIVKEEDRIRENLQGFWDEIQNGEAQHKEVKRVDKFGNDVWFNATFALIRDENDKPRSIIKLALDITEEKKLYLDYRSEMEAINKSNGVIEFDINGIITEVNDVYLEMLSYHRDEIIGAHHSIFLDPEETESAEYELFWRKLITGKFISGRFKRIAKDGAAVWMRGSYTAIVDLDGQVERVIKIAQDISHEVEVETEIGEMSQLLDQSKQSLNITRDKLKEQYVIQTNQNKEIERLELLLVEKSRELRHWEETLDATTARLDLDAKGNILYANAGMLELIKYQLSEIKGLSQALLIEREEFESEAFRSFWQLMEKGKIQFRPLSLVAKDGQKISLMFTFSPLRLQDGRVYKILALAPRPSNGRLLSPNPPVNSSYSE